MPRSLSLGDGLMVVGAIAVVVGVLMTWGLWAGAAAVGVLMVMLGWKLG